MAYQCEVDGKYKIIYIYTYSIALLCFGGINNTGSHVCVCSNTVCGGVAYLVADKV
jgi:hypothetical protein